MQKVVGAYRQLAYDSIYSQTELGAGIIGKTFSSNCQLISSEAEEFSRNGKLSYPDIMDLIKSISRKSSLAKVFYINSMGMAYNAKGVVIKTDLAALLKNVDTSKPVEVFLDEQYFGDNIYTFSVVSPIIMDGAVKGYLVGTDETAHLFTGLNSEYISQISECYVMNNDGLIIASMQTGNESEHVGTNFYESMQTQIRSEAEAEKFTENLRRGLTEDALGSLNVNLVQDNMHLFYTAIPEANHWNLVYCVSNNAIDELVKPVMYEALYTAAGIVVIMLLMCWAVWSYVREDQKQIEKLAYEDPLTAAPNENYFKIKAAKLLLEYHEVPYTVVSFDILNFRFINEAYGHAKADTILQAMAEAAKESFQAKETFARISADRFICLAVNDGRHKARKKFMEDRLNEAAGSVYMNYPVRIKSGYYAVKDYQEDVSDMIDKANLARKAVDVDSKDLEAEYAENLMEETRRYEYVESKMEAALEKGEFVPFLQPKWNMKENCICGAEALVRWKKRDGEIVPPSDFIPIFEKNGFIEKLDFYMLEEVCRYIRKLLDEEKVVYPVSVNQSRYLLHDLEYTQHVQKVLLKYKIPKGLLEFELTETVFFQERERMLQVMKELKELNMELSIDDFGSGYSSLNLLRDIPFDVLKIDRGFLDKTASNESGKWILKKIVEMAEGLGVKVICEGVETQEQVNMLLEVGCIYAQGYLYSKPIPVEEFIEKYNNIEK